MSELNEVELEELYRKMTENELEDLLLKEKCLDRRRLLRKELRVRKNNTSLTRAVSQVRTPHDNNVEPPLIPSFRAKVLSEQKSVENPVSKDDCDSIKKNIQMVTQKSQDLTEEIERQLKILYDELHNTNDLEKRRDLRVKIKTLRENTGTVQTSPLTSFKVIMKNEEIKEPSTKTIYNVSKCKPPDASALPSSFSNEKPSNIKVENKNTKIPPGSKELEPTAAKYKLTDMSVNTSNKDEKQLPLKHGEVTRDKEDTTKTDPRKLTSVKVDQSKSKEPNVNIITKENENRTPYTLKNETPLNHFATQADILQSKSADQSQPLNARDRKPTVTTTSKELFDGKDVKNKGAQRESSDGNEKGKPYESKDIKDMQAKPTVYIKSSVTSKLANEGPPRLFKYKVQAEEGEKVLLKFVPSDSNDISNVVTWTYENKPIDQYPKLYFPNLQCNHNGSLEIILSFSNSSPIKHQGTYKMNAKSTLWSTEAIYEVTIEPKKNVAKPDDNAKIISKTRDEKPNVSIHRGLHESATFHVSRAKHDVASPVSEVILKEENTPKKTNISRVTSMKEMFEKKTETAENVGSRNMRRKFGAPSPSGSDLQRLSEEHTLDTRNSTDRNLSKTNSDIPNTLSIPNPQGRKHSQVVPPTEKPVSMSRRRSSIMDALLAWSKVHTEQYKNVNITNYSSSWADGLAFCALIHHFYPDSFDYSRLRSLDRRQNFNLAFDTARDLAGIDPLLDTDDMLSMDNPDWKCVYVYVQLIYTKLKNHPRNLLKEAGRSN